MKKIVAVLTTAVMVLALAATSAVGSDFSPKIKFGISNTKVKANPSFTVKLEQDEGEEELKSVQLRIPKGFTLPKDAAIPGGTEMGSGTINIRAGFVCRPGPESQIPVGHVLTLPATLEEQDRTQDDIDAGIHSLWNLDITGVTQVLLVVTGSAKKGWVLAGDIPANDNTCPPFSFELTVNEKAGDVPIIKNPKKAGKYVFSATFISADSPAKKTIKQNVKIKK